MKSHHQWVSILQILLLFQVEKSTEKGFVIFFDNCEATMIDCLKNGQSLTISRARKRNLACWRKVYCFCRTMHLHTNRVSPLLLDLELELLEQLRLLTKEMEVHT